MTIKILLLMYLLHIIDDFVFQPICLSKLKQKSWWKNNIKDKNELKKYGNDYITAIIIHSFSWAIMIHLPLFLYASDIFLAISIVINTLIHCKVDDKKANLKLYNLTQDQTIHIIQIGITFFVFDILYLIG